MTEKKMKVSSWALLMMLVLAISVTLYYTARYMYIKSLPYRWDESGFIGKRINDVSPFISEKWDDLGVKGFTVHEEKSDNGLIYYMEIHYSVESDGVKTIRAVKNKIINEDNFGRNFSKERNTGGKKSFQKIWMRIIVFPLEFSY